LIVRPQDNASNATLMPSGTASMARRRRSFAIASMSPLACVEVDEQISSTLAPTAAASSSIDFATSIL